MNSELPDCGEQISCFVDLLINKLPEHRDNRGKRHTLVLVIVGFVSATLVGRHKLSSVHRYICNRVDWLALNELIERCFGVRIHYNESKKWIAIDGKALRGTLDAGEKQNIILAVDHATREAVAQARQCGDKSSEIPAVRELLKESGLDNQKISLDAHHFNPITIPYAVTTADFSNSWNFGFKSDFTCSLNSDFTLSRQSLMACLKSENVS